MGPISCPFSGPKTSATKVPTGSIFGGCHACIFSGLCRPFLCSRHGLSPHGVQGQGRAFLETPTRQSAPTSPPAKPLSLPASQGPRTIQVRKNVSFLATPFLAPGLLCAHNKRPDGAKPFVFCTATHSTRVSLRSQRSACRLIFRPTAVLSLTMLCKSASDRLCSTLANRRLGIP